MVQFHLYEVSRAVIFVEAENRMWLPGPRGWEKQGAVERVSFSLAGEKNSRDWLHKSVNIFNT